MASDDLEYLIVCGQEVHTHDPPAKMLRYLVLRDAGRCRAPFCDDESPAEDIHHAPCYRNTGRTKLDELMQLHATCHREVHQGWQVAVIGGGTFEFTDPAGNTYQTRPTGISPPDNPEVHGVDT